MTIINKFAALVLATASFSAFAGQAATIITRESGSSVNASPRSVIAQYNAHGPNPALYQAALKAAGAVVDPATGLVTLPVTINGEEIIITVDREGRIVDVKRPNKRRHDRDERNEGGKGEK